MFHTVSYQVMVRIYDKKFYLFYGLLYIFACPLLSDLSKDDNIFIFR